MASHKDIPDIPWLSFLGFSGFPLSPSKSLVYLFWVLYWKSHGRHCSHPQWDEQCQQSWSRHGVSVSEAEMKVMAHPFEQPEILACQRKVKDWDVWFAISTDGRPTCCSKKWHQWQSCRQINQTRRHAEHAWPRLKNRLAHEGLQGRQLSPSPQQADLPSWSYEGSSHFSSARLSHTLRSLKKTQ